MKSNRAHFASFLKELAKELGWGFCSTPNNGPLVFHCPSKKFAVMTRNKYEEESWQYFIDFFRMNDYTVHVISENIKSPSLYNLMEKEIRNHES